MKKNKLLLMCMTVIGLLWFLSGTRTAAGEGGAPSLDGAEMIYLSEDVSLHKEADAGSEVVGEMPAGSPLFVLESGEGWKRVLYNGDSAYIISDHIEEAVMEPSVDETIYPQEETEQWGEQSLNDAKAQEEYAKRMSQGKKTSITVVVIAVSVLFLGGYAGYLVWNDKKRIVKE